MGDVKDDQPTEEVKAPTVAEVEVKEGAAAEHADSALNEPEKDAKDA